MNAQTTNHYCRLHYLKNWKRIKEEEQQKAANRLNNYVEGLCKKFPDRYVDAIRREIKTDRGEFQKEGVAPLVDNAEDFYDGFGFQDEEGLEIVLSQIKLDKEF